jgi:hypothetical protein
LAVYENVVTKKPRTYRRDSFDVASQKNFGVEEKFIVTNPRILTLFALQFLLFAVFSASPAFGAACTVTNTSDSGSGSLRDTITNTALSCTTINFSPALLPATILLTSGELLIANSLTINGPGDSNLLAIDGGSNGSVFEIASTATVFISGLTIQNGSSSGNGGGILNNGTLTLNNSTVSGNVANQSGNGIYNGSGGTMTVTNSTLSGNGVSSGAAPAGGGGGIPACREGTICVFGGGAIYNAGILTVTNCTLFGNSGKSDGGGIYNGPGATSNLSSSTLFGNFVPGAAACNVGSTCVSIGGLFNDPSGRLTLKNTILASNSPANCSTFGGPVISEGYNLSDDGSCSISLINPKDLNGVAAGLNSTKSLQNNGGPTQTIALLSDSVARDAIPVVACTDLTDAAVMTDQRGVTRPMGPACDIGAFELVPPYVAQVQQPIKPDGESVFRANRGVVPVKFTLTQNGLAVCQLPLASISLFRTGNSTNVTVTPESYLQASDNGTNFRIDAGSCLYNYNLATSSLGAGAYMVNILIGGGVVGSGIFGLQ